MSTKASGERQTSDTKTQSRKDPSNPKRHKEVSGHAIVPLQDFIAARKQLLEEEKRLGREMLSLAKKRQQLPWREVSEDYKFEGVDGKKVNFSDLFKHSSNTLVVYHFMFDPEWSKGCCACSCWADCLNGCFPHISQRCDIVLVAKANNPKLADFVKSKGWSIPAYSSFGSKFNRDFQVEFTSEEIKSKKKGYNFGSSAFTYAKQAPGMSVFQKHEGKVYHTYSTYGPGLVTVNAMFGVIDMTPAGRDESGKCNMWWVKHREEYE
ncbi:hypothetical protein AAMO2058_001231700 [Amorphochlora amoebiformis]